MVFGMIMLVGMGIGLGTTAVTTTGNDINNLCSNLEDAQDDYNKVKDAYSNLLSSQGEMESKITSYLEVTADHRSTTMLLKKRAKEVFAGQQIAQYISLGIFLLFLILGLLFKYFNVFDNIWKFFTN